MRNQKGISLLALVVALGILTGAATLFLSAISSSRRQNLLMQKQINGTVLASELAELFRAHTTDQFFNYLNTAPGPYPLCTKINFLDRPNTGANPTILQPDPLADLAGDLAMGSTEPKLAANRFYEVRIVDITKLEEQPCAPLPLVKPTGNNRYLVTVGVSWIPPGKGIAEERVATLTTVVAE